MANRCVPALAIVGLPDARVAVAAGVPEAARVAVAGAMTVRVTVAAPPTAAVRVATLVALAAPLGTVTVAAVVAAPVALVAVCPAGAVAPPPPHAAKASNKSEKSGVNNRHRRFAENKLPVPPRDARPNPPTIASNNPNSPKDDLLAISCTLMYNHPRV